MSVLTATSAVLKGVMRLPRKVFGTRNDRLLKMYQRQIEPISRMEADLRREFDQQFGQRLVEDHVDRAAFRRAVLKTHACLVPCPRPVAAPAFRAEAGHPGGYRSRKRAGGRA